MPKRLKKKSGRRILLVDADSRIPNLALMKLSRFHKDQGDRVDLMRLRIPFSLYRKHVVHLIPPTHDKTYCSIVFNGSAAWVRGEGIEFGGSGYSLKTRLPDEVEALEPDYTIYPDNDISYGFISRGCIRKCKFCVVPMKEGKIHQVRTIDEIVRHKKVKFLDNNILALPGHKKILQELIDKEVRCQFNQGLDIRLVDKENSELLRQLKYLGEYIFAFDDWSYLKIIEKKMKLLRWRKDWQFKFFVYCTPTMEIGNVVKRIEWLRENKCLPYYMRNADCWKSYRKEFYGDIAPWCNSPRVFKKMTFIQYMQRISHTSVNRKKRMDKSERLYYDNV